MGALRSYRDRLVQNTLTYPGFQRLFYNEVDLDTQHISQVILQLNEFQETGRFMEGHQYVAVAVRALFVTDIRAEHVERFHLILRSQQGELLAQDFDQLCELSVHCNSG